MERASTMGGLFGESGQYLGSDDSTSTDLLKRRLRLLEYGGSPAKPNRLRGSSAATLGQLGGIGSVDRERKVIRGYVVAQHGTFKNAGRGRFDNESLASIVKLMNSNPTGLGVKSRFAHPSLSDDGIGKFLGRSQDARESTATVIRNGELRTIPAVRADLHLSPSSFKTPSGDLGGYIMDLAESDPDALSSSLVLETEKETVLDADGQPAVDAKGNRVAPIWRPKRIHASDLVDTGDAVDGLLSAGVHRIDTSKLPDALVYQATEFLDRLFPDASPDEIRVKFSLFLDRYFAQRRS